MRKYDVSNVEEGSGIPAVHYNETSKDIEHENRPVTAQQLFHEQAKN